LLAVCDWGRLVDYRDKALLLTAFASGGRRRSEIARLRLEQITREAPVPRDPQNPGAGTLPCLSIALGRTKTGSADEETRVLLIGPPVEALDAWIAKAGIEKGAVFRAIDRWGNLEDKALTPQAVNLIVKRRCLQAGLDPYAFSAHGLRSGFLTEAARRGVPLPEAMRQSQHRSVQQAARYYNDAEARLGAAARLLV
jgi:integrase